MIFNWELRISSFVEAENFDLGGEGVSYHYKNGESQRQEADYMAYTCVATIGNHKYYITIDGELFRLAAPKPKVICRLGSVGELFRLAASRPKVICRLGSVGELFRLAASRPKVICRLGSVGEL